MKSQKVIGSFYQKRGRWFWNVRLPGEPKAIARALIPDGLKLATPDWPVAEDIARRIYKRATLETNGVGEKFDGTVAELVQRFLAHARTYYIDPLTRQPSREVANLKSAADLLQADYPLCRADEFGPAKFMALRTKLVDTVDERRGKETLRRVLKSGETFNEATMTRTFCRNYINQQMGRIKRIFRWGVTSQLVSPTIDHGLRAIPILKHTRTVARETERVTFVERAVVEATLPYLNSTVADLVRVLLKTGMRPGEAAIMRPCDLKTAADGEWEYRPSQHKCKHWGIERLVILRGKALDIVRRRLPKNTQEFVFSPNDARREAWTDAPIRPGAHYNKATLAQAIRQGIKRANKADKKIPPWHANQIRHLVATELREFEGLDVARSVLGHKSLGTTDIYAEVNRGQTSRGMRRMDELKAGA